MTQLDKIKAAAKYIQYEKLRDSQVYKGEYTAKPLEQPPIIVDGRAIEEAERDPYGLALQEQEKVYMIGNTKFVKTGKQKTIWELLDGK